MRITVALDPDTEHVVLRRMREREETFEQAVNALIREGAVSGAEPAPFRTETASMGRSRANLDRASQAAADLDDE